MFKIQDKSIDFDVGREKKSFSLWGIFLQNSVAKNITGKYELFKSFRDQMLIIKFETMD